MIKVTLALLLCAIPFSALADSGTSASATAAESASETIGTQQIAQWFNEVSNWGRWGKDDELGTLNLITPEVKIRAAGLVRHGVTVSLSLDLNKVKSDYNPRPFEHTSSVARVGSQSFAFDRYAVEYHGATHSHIDALAHVIHQGKMYNGFSADLIGSSGSGKLGIHNMKDGIFTRGVLVDMVWFRGVDFLGPGDAITAVDLEAWEAKTGITIGTGDALLVRTGRWERTRQLGPSHLIDGAAGLHASVAKWLKRRDVAVLGADGGNDVIPSGIEGMQAPLHELVLAGLGMPVLDSLDLDALASEALKHERWEFLFVAAPLRVEGGTGAPLNPLAVF